MGSARSHKWAARLRSVGIRRFELVARRLAGYAVAMEVARRAEGPEVNGDLRKTVSRRSLVPSRELKRKGYRSARRPCAMTVLPWVTRVGVVTRRLLQVSACGDASACGFW